MRSSSLKPEFLGLVIAYFKPQVTSFLMLILFLVPILSFLLHRLLLIIFVLSVSIESIELEVS